MPFLQQPTRSRRPSPSRRAVSEAVATFDHPFTIDELEQAAQRFTPGIGRSAVYRTVAWLEAQNRLKRLITPSRRIVFSTCHSPVSCVIECARCGATRQIDDPQLTDHARSLAARAGFTMISTRWSVSATCSNHGKIHRP